MKTKLCTKIKEYKHISLSLLLLIQIGWFFYCERRVEVPQYIMHAKLDDYIPFIKEFVVFYVLWYPYMALSFIYLGVASRKDFIRLLIFISAGMSIAQVIYLIFPNGQDLRPHIEGMDIFSRAVNYLYAIDTPTNVAPSEHVINSIGVYIALAKSPGIKKNKTSKLLLFLTMWGIILSTMFIKQHSILDVLYGMLLSAFLYAGIYVIPGFAMQRRERRLPGTLKARGDEQ